MDLMIRRLRRRSHRCANLDLQKDELRPRSRSHAYVTCTCVHVSVTIATKGIANRPATVAVDVMESLQSELDQIKVEIPDVQALDK